MTILSNLKFGQIEANAPFWRGHLARGVTGGVWEHLARKVFRPDRVKQVGQFMICAVFCPNPPPRWFPQFLESGDVLVLEVYSSQSFEWLTRWNGDVKQVRRRSGHAVRPITDDVVWVF